MINNRPEIQLRGAEPVPVPIPESVTRGYHARRQDRRHLPLAMAGSLVAILAFELILRFLVVSWSDSSGPIRETRQFEEGRTQAANAAQVR